MKISIMQKIKNIFKKISVVIFWLVVWHVAVTVANGGLIIDMPTPITTLKALVRLSSNANFYFAAAMSFLRVILGFLMSVLVGTIGAFCLISQNCFHPFAHLYFVLCVQYL